MSEQDFYCENCKDKGNYELCMKIYCALHNSWIVDYLKRLALYNQKRYEAGEYFIETCENIYPEIENWPPYKELEKIINEGPQK